MVNPLLKKTDLANLFKGTISIANKIQKEYALFVEKEGRILEQKRTQLREDLDNLFSYLVILSNKFRESFLSHDETHDRVLLQEKYNKIVSYGRMRERDIAGIENFVKGYELLIMSKILFHRYIDLFPLFMDPFSLLYAIFHRNDLYINTTRTCVAPTRPSHANS